MSGERRYFQSTTPVIWANVAAGPYVLDLLKLLHINTQIDEYVFLFDRTTEPPDGSYPLDRITVYKNGYASYSPASRGRLFSLGLVIALSSTPTTLTKQTATLLHYSAEGRIP